MTKHWNPKGELARKRAPKPKADWPQGATAGLLFVAVACVGIAAVLYKVAGPRDIFSQ